MVSIEKEAGWAPGPVWTSINVRRCALPVAWNRVKRDEGCNNFVAGGRAVGRREASMCLYGLRSP
jgi:hypothetical protein